MRKYSYESILSAVGRVLDQAEARSFAIRDEQDGLRVDVAGAEERLELRFDLPDLVELVDWKARVDSEPRFDRVSANEGVLRSFLERHELVGASR